MTSKTSSFAFTVSSIMVSANLICSFTFFCVNYILIYFNCSLFFFFFISFLIFLVFYLLFYSLHCYLIFFFLFSVAFIFILFLSTILTALTHILKAFRVRANTRQWLPPISIMFH